MVAHAALEGEAALEAPLVEIVEEQAAHAAGFVAVLEEEILVAPLLEAGIDIVAKVLAGVPRRVMPVQHVFLERIIRGQVEAAAEPPHRRLPFLFRQEKRTLAWEVGT